MKQIFLTLAILSTVLLAATLLLGWNIEDAMSLTAAAQAQVQLHFLTALGALAMLLGAGGAGFFYVTFVRDLPDLTSVADYEPALTSHVYDRTARAIGIRPGWATQVPS